MALGDGFRTPNRCRRIEDILARSSTCPDDNGSVPGYNDITLRSGPDCGIVCICHRDRRIGPRRCTPLDQIAITVAGAGNALRPDADANDHAR